MTVARDRQGVRWLSAHIRVDGSIYSPVCDRMLVDVVSPILASRRLRPLVRRHFVVRYRDPIDHVRLRLLPASTAVSDKIRAILESYLLHRERPVATKVATKSARRDE